MFYELYPLAGVHISATLGNIQPYCNWCVKTICTVISSTVYSHVLIQTVNEHMCQTFDKAANQHVLLSRDTERCCCTNMCCCLETQQRDTVLLSGDTETLLYGAVTHLCHLVTSSRWSVVLMGLHPPCVPSDAEAHIKYTVIQWAILMKYSRFLKAQLLWFMLHFSICYNCIVC